MCSHSCSLDKDTPPNIGPPPPPTSVIAVADMSVVFRIISSISSEFPAFRLFADAFKNPTDKQRLYAMLAESVLSYLDFLFIKDATIHLVLERQTGGKVTKDTRAKASASNINKGLNFIYVSKTHSHKGIGKELINNSSSLSQYDQAMIAKEIKRLRPGILHLFFLILLKS